MCTSHVVTFKEHANHLMLHVLVNLPTLTYQLHAYEMKLEGIIGFGHPSVLA
jgi:hypothetical protein